jgi:uncharacterized protein
MNILKLISEELKVSIKQVEAAVGLLDADATVPFIARYRKEATGGLDDTQLRNLEERLRYLRELVERKEVILNSIKEQGKLTDKIEQQINQVLSKSELEDIYLPYKPKRRTKAQIAIEAGLEPLALALLNNPEQNPDELALQYLNKDKGINEVTDALDGAKYILMDLLSENAEVTQFCRKILWDHASLTSSVANAAKEGAEKFRDYFEYQESLRTVPSHRALALFRGRQLEILKLQINLEDIYHNQCKQHIADSFSIANRSRAADSWLLGCVEWAWKIKLLTRLEVDAYIKLRENAEQEAVHVFSENLHNLLMAAPAGAKVTMGLDPGYRTGVKVAIVDATGKLLAYTAIFPHVPQQQWRESLQQLTLLCKKHKVELISIGNGTASKETDKLAIELIKANPDLKMTKIVVSEAGASVYSASKTAADEFPNLDVSYRGAVSIARRLQDPLAELVKIDPKSIGVGQYQHDVNQSLLARNLDNTVEDCVNMVGVDLNTASVQLLARISGLNQGLAQNIVTYRDVNGSFDNREQLKSVARMGEKTFQQCAGFLRIPNGSNPFDASAVHPEAYPVLSTILQSNKLVFKNIIGNKEILAKLNPSDYTNDVFGLPTIRDIINELYKPGRDPRPEFKTAEFKDGIDTINDLLPGMMLEGVITNVTPFGAFVDIGVHQDGLVHKSRLADRYVENPSDVVKVGQIVKVKVLEIDKERKRISLTMKSDDKTDKKPSNYSVNTGNTNKVQKEVHESVMAQAFAKALSGNKNIGK